MNKQEREDYERQVDQTERSIEATNRLAAAFERVADAQEIAQGYRHKPLTTAAAPTVENA